MNTRFHEHFFYDDGRVKEQGGVGPDHKVGSNHSIKMYYSSVADEELISVFGDEAPASNTCSKRITIDENGTASVEYRDKEGRIIATCLTDNGELKDAITTANGITTITSEASTTKPLMNLVGETVNKLTTNHYLPEGIKESENVYRSVKNITVLGQTDITLTYKNFRKEFKEWCLNYCASCDYHIQIIVRNVEDLTVPISDSDNPNVFTYNFVHKGNNSQDCLDTNNPANGTVQNVPEAPKQSSDENFTITLPGAGTFSIERIVTVNNPQVRTTAPTGENTVIENHVLDAFSGMTTVESILATLGINGITDYKSMLDGYKVKWNNSSLYPDHKYPVSTELATNPDCLKISMPEAFCVDESGCGIGEQPRFEDYLYRQMNTAKFIDAGSNDRVWNTGEEIITLNKFFVNKDGTPKYPQTYPTIANDPAPNQPGGPYTSGMPYIDGQGMFDQLIRNILADNPAMCHVLWEKWQMSVGAYKLYANKETGAPGKIDDKSNDYFDLLEFFLEVADVRKLCNVSESPYVATQLPNDPTNGGYLLMAHKILKKPSQECLDRVNYDPDVWDEVSCEDTDKIDLLTQLYACQKVLPEGSHKKDLLETPPCVPTNAYSANDPCWISYIRWQRGLAKKVSDACTTDCEAKRPHFKEAIRQEYLKLVPPKYIIGDLRPGTDNDYVEAGDPDAVSEATWLCQVESLINNCSSGCTTTQQVNTNGEPVGPWASPSEMDNIKKRNSGWFDIELPSSIAPTCPEGYTSTTNGGGAQKIDILIEYLNKLYKERQKLGYVHKFNFRLYGYLFMDNAGWEDIPSCFFYDMLTPPLPLSPPTPGSLYITVYPNLSGRFSRSRKESTPGCPAECGIEFTQEVPNFDDGKKKRDLLNTFLNDSWGKALTGFTPALDSVSTNGLTSQGIPQYYIYSPILRGSINDSLARLVAATSAQPILDSIRFNGMNGRNDSLPMFIRADVGDTTYTSTIGVIGTRYTDAFAIRDSSGNISAWKGFGTIVVQLPRQDTSDPAEKIVIKLTGLSSGTPAVLDKIVLMTSYVGNRDTSSWSTTLTMEEFLRLSSGNFADSIGKFYISSTGYLRYGSIISGEEIIDYTNLDSISASYATAETGNRVTRTVTWKLACDMSSLCEPADCGICVKWDYLTPPNISLDKVIQILPKSCEQMEIERIVNDIRGQYDKIIVERKKSLQDLYLTTCDAGGIKDELKIEVPLKNYHYTLYYYDRAGNLVKTVPPNGVKASAAYTRLIHPPHTFVTEYDYTSLGQLKRQKTPDGGETRYWYNRKTGQLRFSQNAKQAAESTPTYSYTKYDYLGRVLETGETTIGSPNTPQALADATDPNPAIVYPATGTNPRTQVTRLVYTTPIPDGDFPEPYKTDAINDPVNKPLIRQENTLNRLSYAVYEGDLTTTDDNTATYYSYDVHGNVKWTIQDIAGINGSKIEYEYNLVSGNVTKVKYQDKKADRFYHQYEYDADNRLKAVLTSRDGKIWEQDGNYAYYDHGPMRRNVIGEDSVQAVDYTYTVQGWLKGINHPALNKDYDPGKDGTVPASNLDRATVAEDAFGMTLGYFPGDFDRYSGGTASSFNSTIAYPNKYSLAVPNALYNGNIATWTSNTKASGVPGQQFEGLTGSVFRYDMLNRLRTDDFRKWNTGTELWETVFDNPYSSAYTYDPNGNLKTIKRKAIDGTVKQIDDISFDYLNPTNPTNNKLDRVTDAGVAVAGFSDIKSGQNTGNYQYYDDGKLKSDAQEQISNIEWTVYSKVSKLTKGDGTTIQFFYDASGRRVKKEITNSPTSANNKRTFYVYDAGGQVMATYEQAKVTNGWATLVVLDEWMMYGAARTGIALPHIGIARQFGDPNPLDIIFTRYIGKKRYELNDHLGNVRAVISDVKIPLNGSFVADLFGYTNYYPFGMEQPGRTWNSADFRYGYNGVEKDNELKGLGNSIFTEFRMYDPRLGGRWWSQDPIVKPWESPYAGMANNPIYFSDPSGLNPDEDNKLASPLEPAPAPSFLDNVGSAVGEFFGGLADFYSTEWKNWLANYSGEGDGRGGSAHECAGACSEDCSNPIPDRYGQMYQQMQKKTEEGAIASAKGIDFAVSLTPASIPMDMLKLSWGYDTESATWGLATAPLGLIPGGRLGSKGARFAFGLTDKVVDFASSKGAAHLMKDPFWKRTFKDIISNVDNEIHFTLDGIDEAPMKMILSPNRSGINWEMNTLYKNPTAFEKTIFYYGGKEYKGFDVFKIIIP